MNDNRFRVRCGVVIEGDNFHDFNGEVYCDNHSNNEIQYREKMW